MEWETTPPLRRRDADSRYSYAAVTLIEQSHMLQQKTKQISIFLNEIRIQAIKSSETGYEYGITG